MFGFKAETSKWSHICNNPSLNVLNVSYNSHFKTSLSHFDWKLGPRVLNHIYIINSSRRLENKRLIVGVCINDWFLAAGVQLTATIFKCF